MTVHIFVYKFLFTIVFFWKKEKQHSQSLSHFENKAHSETQFENENVFLED